MGWVTYGSSRLILVGLGNLRFLQVKAHSFLSIIFKWCSIDQTHPSSISIGLSLTCAVTIYRARAFPLFGRTFVLAPSFTTVCHCLAAHSHLPPILCDDLSLFVRAFVRAPILCNNPLLFGQAFALAPILCDDPLLFGCAFARAPILCNDPSLFAVHLHVPPSSATIRRCSAAHLCLPPSSVMILCCLLCVCTATILCNNTRCLATRSRCHHPL